uniref:F-box domain-containing protein n=1 Tax=Steinernema glaseri TaxID=37863 RepID=A0A1I7ZV45_9BILA
MDHLFYDLVEGIVNFLPRKDVETIDRVAARSPVLKNWSIAAEYHLEKRFLLDVDVRVEEHKKKKIEPRVRLIAKKILPDGSQEIWKAKPGSPQWMYAWLRNVTISSRYSTITTRSQEAEMHRRDVMLRTVTLPVDPSAGASLRGDFPVASDLFWKIVQATQKDFVRVEMKRSGKDPSVACKEAVADCIGRGAYLEHLSYVDARSVQKKLWEAIAAQFSGRRGRPLKIHLQQYVSFEYEEIGHIIESWLASDGTYEDKTVSYRTPRRLHATWPLLKEKYHFVMERKHVGYLAHPTRRSSLYIDKNMISVVKFYPWHVPVDFKWVDSLIDDWKEGNGRSVLEGQQRFFFSFQSEDDWSKLLEKYEHENERHIEISHPSNTVPLEMRKTGELFCMYYPTVDLKWVYANIDKWKKGDGRYLCGEGREFWFVFKTEEDWKKLVEKYGSPVNRDGHRIKISHSSNTAWLNMRMKDGLLNIHVRTIRVLGKQFDLGPGEASKAVFFYSSKIYDHSKPLSSSLEAMTRECQRPTLALE